MTRDEILAMEPGRELDALVGQAIGIVRKEVAEAYLKDAAQMDADFEKYGIKNKLPRYSTDISAAWEVVQKLEPTHHFHCSRLHGQDYQKIEGNGYAVDFEFTDEEAGFVNAEGHSLPEAICKAALLAVTDA